MDTRPITPAIPCQDNLAIYCQPVEVMAWLHVMKGRPVCGEHRSCIFCGDRSGSARKTISTDTVRQMIDQPSNFSKGSPIHTTIHNTCTSVETVVGDNTLATCLCCLHWCNRKKNVATTPMMMLKWHFQTLVSLNHKRFDKRVIRRLCTMLSDQHNVYRPLFTADELQAARQIMLAPVSLQVPPHWAGRTPRASQASTRTPSPDHAFSTLATKCDGVKCMSCDLNLCMSVSCRTVRSDATEVGAERCGAERRIRSGAMTILRRSVASTNAIQKCLPINNMSLSRPFWGVSHAL